MKPYKIFLFIALIIGALAAVCYFFPKDGIKVGTAKLRFPSFDDVLVGDTLANVKIDEIDSFYLPFRRFIAAVTHCRRIFVFPHISGGRVRQALKPR